MRKTAGELLKGEGSAWNGGHKRAVCWATARAGGLRSFGAYSMPTDGARTVRRRNRSLCSHARDSRAASVDRTEVMRDSVNGAEPVQGDSQPSRRRRRARPRAWTTNSLISVSFSAVAFLWLPSSTATVHASNVGSDSSNVDGGADEADRLLGNPFEGVNMTKILTEIGRVECPDEVDAAVKKFLQVNELLVDACAKDSDFQLSAVMTALPEAEQTTKICSSPNCMDLFSGVVLAKFPECELRRYSPRSLAESFVRVRVDLRNNRVAPTSKEFDELYTVNRAINYLNDDPAIQARVNTTFDARAVAKQMNSLDINTDIVLTDGMGVFRTTDSNTPTTMASSAPMLGSTSSGSSSSSKVDASAGDVKLPENLQTAYIYVGLLWLLCNALYFWMITRKSGDE